MSYLDLLVEFYEQLDLTKLRIQRPSPFIFLCGGPVDLDTPPSAAFKSLRDLVWRSGRRIKCRFVLAESAQELFTYSSYDDLVEFEAHIAQISDLVLLICESPGSLAELGAFASEPAIANRLYVLVHADHHGKPSFIMLGPLRRLKHHYPDSVGKWEWRMVGDAVDTSSISITELEDEINFKVGEKAKWAVEKFNPTSEAHTLIRIYWIIYILRAATVDEITKVANKIGIEVPSSTILKFLYAMKVADWIREETVTTTFYYVYYDEDPFRYAYKDTKTKSGEHLIWKSKIAAQTKNERPRPAQVLNLVGGAAAKVAI